MKKKFLITPAVQYCKKRKVFIFSIENNWFEFANKMNMTLEIYNYSDKENLNNFDGVFFSGRNDLKNIKNNMENNFRERKELKLLKKCIQNKKKIFGICKGFQIINKFFGGTVKKIKNHVRRDHILNPFILHKNNFIKISTNSFHNYGICKLADSLEPIAITKDGNIEIAINEKKKIFCTMFHPERKNISQKVIDGIFKSFL